MPYIYIYMYIYIYAYIYVCGYIYIYILHTYTHTHVYIYIYIYTQLVVLLWVATGGTRWLRAQAHAWGNAGGRRHRDEGALQHDHRVIVILIIILITIIVIAVVIAIVIVIVIVIVIIVLMMIITLIMVIYFLRLGDQVITPLPRCTSCCTFISHVISFQLLVRYANRLFGSESAAKINTAYLPAFPRFCHPVALSFGSSSHSWILY